MRGRAIIFFSFSLTPPSNYPPFHLDKKKKISSDRIKNGHFSHSEFRSKAIDAIKTIFANQSMICKVKKNDLNKFKKKKKTNKPCRMYGISYIETEKN